jgi:Flp pilus assembly protein TadB
MIGVGAALIVVGIILLFMLPWVGIPIAMVGLVLAVLWLVGVGRTTARAERPADRRV